MKLAILGSSPIALEAVLRFHTHGAAVTWFKDPREEEFPPLSLKAEWANTTSALGWELLGKPNLVGNFSAEAWAAGYRDPLIEVLKGEQEFKPFQVVSITKRFLTPQESVKGKSRFYDLFRVIYQLNPSEFVEKQKESDPEMYERLSQEMVQSLQSTLEMYEDFDLIIDLRKETVVKSLNDTGRALGEGRVSHDKVTRGYDILRDLPLLIKNRDNREMILIGSGEVALESLFLLEAWIRDPSNRLFLATTEETPFESVLQNATDEVKEKFKTFMSTIQSDWENEMNSFHEKLREWQGLDDFIQAKKPRPAEPIPQLNFFSGHNVTAIDQLIDRKRLFLTLEKPEFRDGNWQPENNVLELKTLGVDHVLVANRMTRENVLTLDQNEKGYFSMIPVSMQQNKAWENDLKNLKGIEDEIFKLFSPADAH